MLSIVTLLKDDFENSRIAALTILSCFSLSRAKNVFFGKVISLFRIRVTVSHMTDSHNLWVKGLFVNKEKT